MGDHVHTKELIDEVSKEFGEILEGSKQSIYIYLDDTLKVCNKNFSDLLGYESPEEWAAVDTNFPEAFVAEESQEILINAFQDAMEKTVGSSADITWKTKSGENVKTKVVLVPISFDGHLMALHFIEKVK